MILRSDCHQMFLRDIILTVHRVYYSSHILIKLVLPSQFTTLLSSCYKQFIKLAKSKKIACLNGITCFLWLTDALGSTVYCIGQTLPTIENWEEGSQPVHFKILSRRKYYANKTLRLVRQALTLVGMYHILIYLSNILTPTIQYLLSVLCLGYQS